MFDTLTETFISEYFLYRAVLGNYFPCESMYEILKKIFCLKNTVGLESLESELLNDIVTAEDYKRMKRIKQYQKLNSLQGILTEEEETLVNLKGMAITSADECELHKNEDTPKSLMECHLHQFSKQGNINAMRILGTLECEGIFVSKDKKKGVAHLKKSAQWGDFPAALALLYYDEKNRQKNFSKLLASMDSTPYEYLCETIMKHYHLKEAAKDYEMMLLKKAFASGKLRQDTYEPRYARLIFSPVLSLKDKEKTLFSENKEMISEVCDLPLKMVDKDIEIDESKLKNMPLERLEEQSHILTSLKNSDLRKMKNYKTMGIVCDSEYVKEAYIQTLTQIFVGSHVERIEVSDLREIDFDSTKNNIFIRSLEETNNNIYLLVLNGEISEGFIEFIKNFLKSDKREKFHLNYPAVTLDLKSVLPICICDTENASKLNEQVDFIKIASVKNSEKPRVIESIIQQKSTNYSLSATIEEHTIEKLCSFSLEYVDKILDKVFKENRKIKKSLEINFDFIRPYLEEKYSSLEKTTYGFGGHYENN